MRKFAAYIDLAGRKYWLTLVPDKLTYRWELNIDLFHTVYDLRLFNDFETIKKVYDKAEVYNKSLADILVLDLKDSSPIHVVTVDLVQTEVCTINTNIEEEEVP